MTTQPFHLTLLIGAIVSFAPIAANSQTTSAIAVELAQCNKLYVGLDNPVTIVAQQNQAVLLEQVQVITRPRCLAPVNYRNAIQRMVE